MTSLISVPALPAGLPDLSTQGVISVFFDQCKAMPKLRAGPTNWNSKILPLSDPSFSWQGGYIFEHPLNNGSGLPGLWSSNGDADVDPNGDLNAALGKNAPISWLGNLRLTAQPTPADLVKTIGAKDPTGYISGCLSSYPFGQQYGIFVMYAKIPKGAGLWPAFWLMPCDLSWPPEIDIMEVLGADTTTVFNTLHAAGLKTNQVGGYTRAGVDLSENFHAYALDWGPKTMTWYLDSKPIFSQPTPADCHKPFYMICNLAVGKASNWGGAPNAATKFPATMQVEGIHVWQRPQYLNAA